MSHMGKNHQPFFFSTSNAKPNHDKISLTFQYFASHLWSHVCMRNFFAPVHSKTNFFLTRKKSPYMLSNSHIYCFSTLWARVSDFRSLTKVTCHKKQNIGGNTFKKLWFSISEKDPTMIVFFFDPLWAKPYLMLIVNNCQAHILRKNKKISSKPSWRIFTSAVIELKQS